MSEVSGQNGSSAHVKEARGRIKDQSTAKSLRLAERMIICSEHGRSDMGCCARRVPVAARRILWRGKEKHPPCASFALVLIMLWCATLAQCRDTKNLARAPVGTSGPREAGMTDDQEELESRNALEQAFGHLGGSLRRVLLAWREGRACCFLDKRGHEKNPITWCP